MATELFEDSPGDPRNSRTLAIASELAYLPAEAGKEAYQSRLGLEANLISVGNTQVYLGEN